LKDVMSTDLAQPEKLFRVALREREFDFARQLIESGVVPIDTDLIFNCCSCPSDEALEMIIPILEDVSVSIPVGWWKRGLHYALHALFLRDDFTVHMEIVARLLGKFTDINTPGLGTCHIFDTMLESSRLSLTKVRAMVEIGLDLSNVQHHSNVPFKGTITSFLTHGVEIDTMIEILAYMRDHLKK